MALNAMTNELFAVFLDSATIFVSAKCEFYRFDNLGYASVSRIKMKLRHFCFGRNIGHWLE